MRTAEISYCVMAATLSTTTTAYSLPYLIYQQVCTQPATCYCIAEVAVMHAP